MGDFLSGVLGTNSQVGVATQNPYQALNGWQNTAGGLANQLQTQAAGGGPNPAQLQLQQNAGQLAQAQAQANAQNRAINPGLAARLSGNQAVQAGQTAASNAGIQQAQQQLMSQQLLGNLTSQQQTALNQAGAVNAGIGAGNQKGAQGIVGGLLNGAGGAIGAASSFAQGGMVLPPHLKAINDIYASNGFDEGGTVPSDEESDQQENASSSESSSKSPPQKSAMGSADPVSLLSQYMSFGRANGGLIPEIAKLAPLFMAASKGGKVPAMLSPGEKYLSPEQAKKVADKKESPMSVGKKVPGKAAVSGDSPKNDTVKASLEEGGVVIPRSIMQSDNPAENAAKFVAQQIQKNQKGDQSDFKDALKRAISGRKNKSAA